MILNLRYTHSQLDEECLRTLANDPNTWVIVTASQTRQVMIGTAQPTVSAASEKTPWTYCTFLWLLVPLEPPCHFYAFSRCGNSG